MSNEKVRIRQTFLGGLCTVATDELPYCDCLLTTNVKTTVNDKVPQSISDTPATGKHNRIYIQ